MALPGRDTTGSLQTSPAMEGVGLAVGSYPDAQGRLPS